MSGSTKTWARLSAVMLFGASAFGGYIAHDMINRLEPETGPLGVAQAESHGAAAATAAPSTGPFGLGREATANEVAAWDIDIRPDGQGLPVGSGDVATGEELFLDQCAVCHGEFGEGAGRWPVLVGGAGTLASADPVKTVGSYWPYLSTVYDYVHRAMPFGAAQTLSDDDVYAITAYILYMNDLVDDDFELSNANFAEFRMPNEENFFMDDRETTAVWQKREVCMTDCKPSVEITRRAAVLDVTPETGDNPSGEAVVVEAAAAEAPAAEATPTAEAAPAEAGAIDMELAAAGEKVFKKCKACHQVGDGAKHRTGPHLNELFGRVAGTADGFSKYSSVIAEAGAGGLTWTPETLAAFLEDPKGYLRGTKMSFRGLNKPDDLAAVTEYLRQYSQ